MCAIRLCVLYECVCVCVSVCMGVYAYGCVCVCMIRECFEKGYAKRVALAKDTKIYDKTMHHKRLHFLKSSA